MDNDLRALNDIKKILDGFSLEKQHSILTYLIQDVSEKTRNKITVRSSEDGVALLNK